ncbi:MAG: glutamate--tRNA ligase family protein [Myxococcota bacterium]|jgi:glutamyl-Q tRNA(Asp) synthetase
MRLETDVARRAPFARGRFAPSTTGPAHPGTLLAALLCWLDARSAGAEVVLRLEDLDLDRTKPGYVDGLRRDLEWFGLEWDEIVVQSHAQERHETALVEWIREGRVYACECSRSEIRAAGRLAPDGSHAYPGTCRARRVTVGDWRNESQALRLELPSEWIELRDETGADLSGDAAADFGDPILRRRDGAFSYHFVSVLDDAAERIDRVVRGRDLMPTTRLQVALRKLLGLSVPSYRHHCLFLERRGEKLSKLHGAVDIETLRQHYDAEGLCGRLAELVGLGKTLTGSAGGLHCRPDDLVSGFEWAQVRSEDRALVWDGTRLISELKDPS